MKRFSFRSSIIPPYRQKGNRLPSSVMQSAAGGICIRKRAGAEVFGL